MKTLKNLLRWSLIAIALTPAIYGNSTITPSQNAKTLFLRFLLSLASIFFVLLVIQSYHFRNEIKSRLAVLWKHPLFKITTALYVVLVLSTIFAFHHFIGFLGEVEREEGFLGLTFFYSLFFFTMLVFQKRDRHKFFGILMFTQLPILIFAIGQFAQGTLRANSILGNPIYFASYALCLLFVSIAMYLESKRNNKTFSKVLSVISIIMAIIEIFMSNTRSVLLGVIVAIIISFVYVFFKPESIFPKVPKIKIRKIAIVIFSVFLVFSVTFFATRHAKVWTHIPGFDRLSASNIDDATTKSRLASWSIAVHSINPVQAGPVRFLVGYGWDNYFYAWQKFYNPDIYQYDTATFDRPHNKLLDMLVMNGVLGFLLYLIFWFFFFKTVFRYSRKDGAFAILCVFWGVAFFIQNLFAFDSIISWIISFAIFAFVIEKTEVLEDAENVTLKSNKNYEK